MFGTRNSETCMPHFVHIEKSAENQSWLALSSSTKTATGQWGHGGLTSHIQVTFRELCGLVFTGFWFHGLLSSLWFTGFVDCQNIQMWNTLLLGYLWKLHAIIILKGDFLNLYNKRIASSIDYGQLRQVARHQACSRCFKKIKIKGLQLFSLARWEGGGSVGASGYVWFFLLRHALQEQNWKLSLLFTSCIHVNIFQCIRNTATKSF